MKRLIVIQAVAYGQEYVSEQEEVINGPWLNQNLSPDERADLLIQEMSFNEKIGFLVGGASLYTGHTPAIRRLSIPAFNMNDGPQGFRWDTPPGTTTQFPAALRVASSWDPNIVYSWAEAMGQEFHGKGANVQLGPGLNVNRIPTGGRNFEYLSGEDPYLGYIFSQEAVRGIQDQKVMANAKHFIDNSQETFRTTINEVIDERTQFEMYYPPFEGAIEADVASIMCSYNLVNGNWSCENNSTLNTDLRERLGFKGWVMSDWSATHSMSMPEGLDQEMGDAKIKAIWKRSVLEKVDPKLIDQSVHRQLRSAIKIGAFDDKKKGNIESIVTSHQHQTIARQIAEDSVIMLKNENEALPLRISDPQQKILILGQGNQAYKPFTHGSGSGHVSEFFVRPPIWEICERLGVERFLDISEPKHHCNPLKGHCITYGGSKATKLEDIKEEYDTAIIFIGQDSGEGHDRQRLGFDEETNQMISQFGQNGKKNGKKTIVVMSVPGVVTVPWKDDVDAILVDFYSGEKMAESIFNIIYGVINPSGKLPVTIPNKENEQNMTVYQFPGVNKTAVYSEHLLMGYRWYDANDVAPAYPFGHGISYTSFIYSNLQINGRQISVDVTNSGSLSGKEIVQLYLGFPSEAGEPPKLLKGFKKLSIEEQDTQTASFELRDRDISIWDVETHSWKIQKGEFKIYIGASNRDIRLETVFNN